MEYTTVELSSKFNHRYKFKARVYNVHDKQLMDVEVFMDLGCYNTLVPQWLAVEAGYPLGFKRRYRLGGNVVETEAFVIKKMVIKDVVLERVLVFAADLSGEHANDILLGTNVMNNWEMIIHKKSNTFKFREDPPDNLPGKTYIYQNYFNELGEYVYVQN